MSNAIPMSRAAFSPQAKIDNIIDHNQLIDLSVSDQGRSSILPRVLEDTQLCSDLDEWYEILTTIDMEVLGPKLARIAAYQHQIFNAGLPRAQKDQAIAAMIGIRIEVSQMIEEAFFDEAQALIGNTINRRTGDDSDPSVGYVSYE